MRKVKLKKEKNNCRTKVVRFREKENQTKWDVRKKRKRNEIKARFGVIIRTFEAELEKF